MAGSFPLEDIKVPIRLKLSALWASLMFCYIYGDYFGLYQPGNLQDMLKGQMGPLGPTTQGVLLGTAALMAVPSLMVFLSLALPSALCRWLNVVLGVVYAAIIVISMPGSWAFYQCLGVIEAVLSLLIAWKSWRWPRADQSSDA